MSGQGHRRRQRIIEPVEFAQRSGWFLGHPHGELREPDISCLLQGRKKSQQLKAPRGLPKWESIGPSNIGGRSTSLAVPPNKPDRIYLGTAGGGVWLSNDVGKHWRRIWPDHWVLTIGALAIDPNSPEVIYCGTGEANGSGDSYPGVGLYRSTDAGKTWKHIATPEKHGIPRRIAAIAIDPFDSRHIRVGGVAGSDGKWAMLVSGDGGRNWQGERLTRSHQSCHSIVFHPLREGVLFATIQSARGDRTGIWRSLDNGAHWHELHKGLLPPERVGRTSLAIAPSRPDLVYALAATRTGSGHLLPGVFRSDDMGDRWRRITTNYPDENEMFYNSCIVVHPEDPEFLLWGGVDLYLTRNGGVSWRKVTDWTRTRGEPSYSHADHHALAMPPRTNGRIYSANDGGLDVSEDGETWKNRSNGLAATMFYDIDVAESSVTHYGGGTQDNGTIITTSGRQNDFHEILGADGGWMIYDPDDSSRILASEQRMDLYVFRNGKKKQSTFHGRTKKEIKDVWMAFIAPDYNNAHIAYTGSTRIWKTTNKGVSWNPVSDPLDGTPLSAIEVATRDSNYVYVGTQNGGFYRSSDAGATWSHKMGHRDLPRREITRIESHPLDPQFLVATFAQGEDKTASSHVFCSKDGGGHWKDIDRGRLPSVQHTSLRFRPDQSSDLYVSNYAGVFLTTDLGQTWWNVTGNLPNALIVDLVYHEKTRTLIAATYGRGLWRLRGVK